MTLPTTRRRSFALGVGAALGAVALIAPMAAAVAEPPGEDSEIEVVRLAGDNRYGTAHEVAKYDFDDDADDVFLALGTDFADALAGAPAAYVEDAPILLTRSDRLPKETKEALGDLNPDRVHILGGEAAISSAVITEVRAAVTGTVSVTRYAKGADRYGTSVEVSQKTHGDGADTVYVANGRAFPDALAAGPLAAEEDAPILLIREDRIPAVVVEELERLDPDYIVVLGETTAISAGVELTLEEYASKGVDRIGGDDRYATAVEISKALDDDSDTVYFATGLEFADALAGGPSAAEADAPILLVREDRIPAVTLGELVRLNPDKIVILGGKSAIADSVEKQAREALAPEVDEGDENGNGNGGDGNGNGGDGNGNGGDGNGNGGDENDDGGSPAQD